MVCWLIFFYNIEVDLFIVNFYISYEIQIEKLKNNQLYHGEN
jgi:hypothetical protein